MVAAKKGVYKSCDGGDAATLDDYAPVELGGQLYEKNIHPSTCEVLIEQSVPLVKTTVLFWEKFMLGGLCVNQSRSVTQEAKLMNGTWTHRQS